MIRLFGSLIVLLSIALVADASCRRVAKVVEAVAVVQPVAVATFVPVAVPAYGVGYAGEGNAELIRRIDDLQREIQSLRGVPQKGAKESLTEHPGIGALRANCASCHTGKAAKGTFKMFEEDGKFISLSDKSAFKVAKELFSGRMPKGGKIADEALSKISSYLDTVK